MACWAFTETSPGGGEEDSLTLQLKKLEPRNSSECSERYRGRAYPRHHVSQCPLLSLFCLYYILSIFETGVSNPLCSGSHRRAMQQHSFETGRLPWVAQSSQVAVKCFCLESFNETPWPAHCARLYIAFCQVWVDPERESLLYRRKEW